MNIFSNNRETISIFPVYVVTNEQNWRLDKYQQYQPIGIVSLLSHSNASFLPFSFKMGPTLKRDDYVGGKHDALVSPPVSAELVVVVEPVYLLPGHQVGQDELGLYGHHGHRLEGEEDALAGHRVPGRVELSTKLREVPQMHSQQGEVLSSGRSENFAKVR